MQIITNAPKFIDLLKNIEDPRDNRGKRHELFFVIACTISAILSGKNYVSELQRYISNHYEWLKAIFNCEDANPTAVSRAQLPNILSVIDWSKLNEQIEFFSVSK